MNLVHLENDDALPGVASENPSKQLVRTQDQRKTMVLERLTRTKYKRPDFGSRVS